jgi:hypothetical protein
VPGRIVSFSETELAVESAEVHAPVHAPLRIRWNGYVALGEVLAAHGDGPLRVTTVSLHHLVDLAAAAESSAYWS